MGDIGRHILPILIFMASYRFEPEQLQRVEDDALNQLSGGYEIEETTKGFPSSISTDSYICKIRRVDDEDSRTYIISVFSHKRDSGREMGFQCLNEPQIRRLFNSFMRRAISVFTIAVGHPYRLEDSVAELKRYSHHGRSVISAGIIRNHVLATLKEDVEGDYLRRDFLLFPLETPLERAAGDLWSFTDEVALYASTAGRLYRLFQERAAVFAHVESSEKNTRERLQEILVNIRRPPDQVKPADLGSMLTEVSGIFSRLTTITSSMRRDSIKAKGYFRRIKGIFNLWNEKPLEGYPTNSSIEIDRLEEIVDSFSDSVDRLQALRIQLDTVLDTIRTYVGIQQQNISVEEQRDTKKLLARMVNLQEVLHKLEILIVAFYITEMGRLVFDAVAHDMVDILTVAFIPIALLLAIGIRRLLHG